MVTPFLPGDSLLFAAGALAAAGGLNVWAVIALLSVAAVLGDAVNYAAGRFVGPRVFSATDRSSGLHRLLNREHLQRTHAFFEKYGGKAVVLGRFVPIVRTFVPFVAGAGAMTYARFAVYNVVGGLIWVGICTLAGYCVRDGPDRQEQLLTLRARHRVRLCDPDRGRDDPASFGPSELRHTSTTCGARASARATAGPEGPALHGARRSTASAPPSWAALDTRAGSGSPTPAHQAPIQSG